MLRDVGLWMILFSIIGILEGKMNYMAGKKDHIILSAFIFLIGTLLFFQGSAQQCVQWTNATSAAQASILDYLNCVK